MEKLLDALYFANAKHISQIRKDKITPYIAHPLSVAIILLTITQDEDLVIASILHDLVEDADVSETEINNRYGPRVAEIVMACTEKNRNESWRNRKQEALDSIKNMDGNVASVKLADILHNTYDLKRKVEENGISFFDNFNASAQDKIAYERARLNEFIKYFESNPLIKHIEKNLQFLENQIKLEPSAVVLPSKFVSAE